MAKDGAIDHPKTMALASELAIDPAHALGLMEALWAFARKYAPDGAVGKYSDVAIVTGMRSTLDPTRVVRAFLAAGLMDESGSHRIVIHDWEDHATGWTKKALRGKPFVKGDDPRRANHHEKTGEKEETLPPRYREKQKRYRERLKAESTLEPASTDTAKHCKTLQNVEPLQSDPLQTDLSLQDSLQALPLQTGKKNTAKSALPARDQTKPIPNQNQHQNLLATQLREMGRPDDSLPKSGSAAGEMLTQNGRGSSPDMRKLGTTIREALGHREPENPEPDPDTEAERERQLAELRSRARSST